MSHKVIAVANQKGGVVRQQLPSIYLLHWPKKEKKF